MTHEEPRGPCIHIEEEPRGPCIFYIHLENTSIQNCQVGAYNTIQQDSNNSCLLHEDCCTTCESECSHRAVSQENTNYLLKLIGYQNKKVIDESNRSVKTLHKRFDDIIWEQRHIKSRLDNIGRVSDGVAHNKKTKKKNKWGKFKNWIKQKFNHKSKANEDDTTYDTISSYDFQEQQPLHEGASQEQQSFTEESPREQQPLSDEAIQDQSFTAYEERYSNLLLYSSSRNNHLYENLDNVTNIEINYKNVNEDIIAASESPSGLVQAIATNFHQDRQSFSKREISILCSSGKVSSLIKKV